MQSVIIPVGDTYISRHYPSTNFSDKEYLSAGLECWRKNINIYKSLMKFDIPQMPAGTELNTATLRLYVKQLCYASNVIIRVNIITSYFDTDKVTWNNAPSTTPTNLVFYVNKNTVDSFVDIDISEPARNWLLRKMRNVGIALTVTMDEEGVALFASTRNPSEINPKIIIDYSSIIGPAGPTGPAGPMGPAGPAGKDAKLQGIQVQLTGAGGNAVDDGGTIVFDTVINDHSTNISYNTSTGQFTINKEGNYYCDWWVSTGGTDGEFVGFGINADGVSLSSSYSPDITGQLNGTSLVTITEAPALIELVNISGGQVLLAGTPVQASLVIIESGL